MSQFELKKPIQPGLDCMGSISSEDINILGPHAFTIYVIINIEGKCPSIKWICKISGFSEKIVMRSLRVLEEYGYIQKITRQIER